MIGEFIYMLQSDMNLRIGNVKNYNNKILISLPCLKIGTNLKINRGREKDKPDAKSKREETIKTKRNIESNKERKQDIKMIKAKPNIEFKSEEMMKLNPARYSRGRKSSFDIENNIYLYSMVDFEMIYLLLVFVIKYVYIKTPTPAITNQSPPLLCSKSTKLLNL